MNSIESAPSSALTVTYLIASHTRRACLSATRNSKADGRPRRLGNPSFGAQCTVAPIARCAVAQLRPVRSSESTAAAACAAWSRMRHCQLADRPTQCRKTNARTVSMQQHTPQTWYTPRHCAPQWLSDLKRFRTFCASARRGPPRRPSWSPRPTAQRPTGPTAGSTLRVPLHPSESPPASAETTPPELARRFALKRKRTLTAAEAQPTNPNRTAPAVRCCAAHCAPRYRTVETHWLLHRHAWARTHARMWSANAAERCSELPTGPALHSVRAFTRLTPRHTRPACPLEPLSDGSLHSTLGTRE